MRGLTQVLILGASLYLGCVSNDSIDDVDLNEDSVFGQYKGTYNANTKDMELFVQLRLGGDGGTTVRMAEGLPVTNWRLR